MAHITHAAQIDLCFGDPAREFLEFSVGVWPGNFARKPFDLFGQGWIGANRQAQPVAKRVLRRASAASSGLRAGAGAHIRAVGLDLAVARQSAFLPFAGVVSITLNSASSISCTFCRSVAPRTADAARSRRGWRCGGSQR